MTGKKSCKEKDNMKTETNLVISHDFLYIKNSMTRKKSYKEKDII